MVFYTSKKVGESGYTRIFKNLSQTWGPHFPKISPKNLLWETGFLIAGYTLANKRRPGLKMYSLLNMGIFQPAMLVYQKLSFVVPED